MTFKGRFVAVLHNRSSLSSALKGPDVKVGVYMFLNKKLKNKY